MPTTATFQNEGTLEAEEILQGALAEETWWLVPCEDGTAIANTDTYATRTVTALVGGSPVQLTGGNWTRTVAGADAQAVYIPVTFTFVAYAGGHTITGWMVYLQDGGGVKRSYFAAKLPTPFAVPSAGGSLEIDLTYHLKQC